MELMHQGRGTCSLLHHQGPLDRRGRANSIVARGELAFRVALLQVLLGHMLPHLGIGCAHQVLEAAKENAQPAVLEQSTWMMMNVESWANVARPHGRTAASR